MSIDVNHDGSNISGNEWSLTFKGTDEGGQGVVKPTEYIQKPFAEAAQGLGGAYLGVGTHQNFTYIAAARSTEAFIVDRSPLAINTLRAHRLVHLHKETPDQYIDFWSKNGHLAMEEVKKWGLSKDELTKVESIVVPYGEGIGLDLFFDREDIRKKSETLKSSWLASEEDYSFIRQKFLDDRIHIVNADLQNVHIMDQIGARLRQLGHAVNVIYSSNVEDHLAGEIRGAPAGNIGQFWHNVQSLPISDRTKILRTIRTFANISPDDTFYYVIQSMADMMSKDYQTYDDLLQDISDQITNEGLGVTTMPVPIDLRDGYIEKHGFSFP